MEIKQKKYYPFICLHFLIFDNETLNFLGP